MPAVETEAATTTEEIWAKLKTGLLKTTEEGCGTTKPHRWRRETWWWNKDSSLDKQRICVNTQLKSSKKQLKLNVCVPKSNSVDRYAITCDVIAYHLVHFVSICVI